MGFGHSESLHEKLQKKYFILYNYRILYRFNFFPSIKI
jgi:hypothetical protein